MAKLTKKYPVISKDTGRKYTVKFSSYYDMFDDHILCVKLYKHEKFAFILMIPELVRTHSVSLNINNPRKFNGDFIREAEKIVSVYEAAQAEKEMWLGEKERYYDKLNDGLNEFEKWDGIIT